MAARDIDAIILAGGMGTRLRSIVSDVPKPLAPVGGRPFLDILLEQLSSWQRLRRVVLAISYGAEQFMEHYGRKAGYPFELAFSVETTPQGTAGAIRQALDNTSSAQVLILNGDTYVHVDFDELLIAHQHSSARLTIVAIRVKDASRFGSIEVDTSSMGVTGFREKQEGLANALVNAGCYLGTRSFLEALPLGRKMSIETEFLPHNLTAVKVFVTSGLFLDIGTPESYTGATYFLSALRNR